MMSTGFAEPLPRDLDAIKAWYRASQARDELRHGHIRDLPARVVHQIQGSLVAGLPLYVDHVNRLIEYAKRFEGEGP